MKHDSGELSALPEPVIEIYLIDKEDNADGWGCPFEDPISMGKSGSDGALRYSRAKRKACEV